MMRLCQWSPRQGRQGWGACGCGIGDPGSKVDPGEDPDGSSWLSNGNGALVTKCHQDWGALQMTVHP